MTLSIHRWWLSLFIETKERRRPWLSSIHQVATKAHATRVCRPSLSVDMYPKILSKISGVRVMDDLGYNTLDPWGDHSPNFRCKGRNKRRLTHYISRSRYGFLQIHPDLDRGRPVLVLMSLESASVWDRHDCCRAQHPVHLGIHRFRTLEDLPSSE